MDTFKIKKGLGRGLSSLIGETKSKDKINKVAISNLVRNKHQPRKVFNKEFGTESLLDPVFDFYREAFLDLVVRTPKWARTINATEGGSLFGQRIENMKFTDFLTLK